MIKRTLYFGNPASLNKKESQLIIRIADDTLPETSVPIEDIGMIILDSHSINLTSGLIQALQENNVAIISCDQRHMPQSLTLPLEGNTIQQERYDEQINASSPLKSNYGCRPLSVK